MKKLLFNIVIMAVVAIMSVGCAEEVAPVNGAAFEVESYDDFLWDEYIPDTLKFTINAEFKECGAIKKPLVLALCDANGKVVPTNKAQVYVDGVPARGNKMEIEVVGEDESEIEVGIVISEELLVESAVYDWHIKLEDNAGLSQVLSKDQSGAMYSVGENDPWMLGMDVCVVNNRVANSLKVGFDLGLLATLAILLLIFILGRRKNPSVKFTRITIDTGDGDRVYSTQGCYKVVLTSNSNLKFGFWHWFTNGKVTVIYNEFWTSDVTIKKARGSNLIIRTAGDYILPDEPVRREEFIIKNDKGQKATLTTN